MNTNFDKISRFKDAPWLNKKVNVILIGLGGIGSHTSLLLYKTIPLMNLYLIDIDNYEPHNLGTQLMFPQHVGLYKSYGSKLLLSTFTSGINNSYSVMCFKEDILTSTKIKDLIEDHNYVLDFVPLIIISAVDSMKVRKFIYNEAKNKVNDIKTGNILLIDGRLNATSYEVFTVNLFNEGECFAYEKSLLSDEEVPDGVCTMRQTFHFGSMIGSRIVQIITNWLSNLENKEKGHEIELYNVPFFIQEIGDGFIFKTMTTYDYINRMNKF